MPELSSSDTASPEPADLTTRRHLQTRTDLAAAAIDLFLANGFDETTMADIAAEAGISRRTAYRHFPSKDDLVYEYPRRWLERFDAIVSAAESTESPRAVIERGLRAVAQMIDDDTPKVLRSYSVVLATPSLRGRHAKSDELWMARCAAIVAPAYPETADGHLQIAVLVSALVGATNALIGTWAAQQPDADIVAMVERVFAQIAPLWPVASAGTN